MKKNPEEGICVVCHKKKQVIQICLDCANAQESAILDKIPEAVLKWLAGKLEDIIVLRAKANEEKTKRGDSDEKKV